MNNRILIGLIVLGWVIISFLFCRCHYLQQKLEIAETNILSLTESNENMAIAYQEDYLTFKAQNDSLRRELGVNRKTKEVVRVKETVVVADTVVVLIENSIQQVQTFELDTTLQNDYRTLHIKIEADSAVLRLSEGLSVPCWISYRVDQEKRLKRHYSSWFGNRVWGPLFGKKVKVDVVRVKSDNPLIEIDSTQFIEIIH